MPETRHDPYMDHFAGIALAFLCSALMSRLVYLADSASFDHDPRNSALIAASVTFFALLPVNPVAIFRRGLAAKKVAFLACAGALFGVAYVLFAVELIGTDLARMGMLALAMAASPFMVYRRRPDCQPPATDASRSRSTMS